MTRITERSPYYPDGVRRTSTTAATHFLPDLMPDGTLNSIYARPVHDCQLGGICPSMGSIELAYEEGTSGADLEKVLTAIGVPVEYEWQDAPDTEYDMEGYPI